SWQFRHPSRSQRNVDSLRVSLWGYLQGLVADHCQGPIFNPVCVPPDAAALLRPESSDVDRAFQTMAGDQPVRGQICSVRSLLQSEQMSRLRERTPPLCQSSPPPKLRLILRPGGACATPTKHEMSTLDSHC